MSRILALDPGSTRTGWVLLDRDTRAVVEHGIDDNPQLEAWYRDDLVNDDETLEPRDTVLIEGVRPRGQTMHDQTLEAVWWAGRLGATLRAHPVIRVTRQEVVRKLLGRTNLSDPDARIRALIIDRYGGIGGKAAAVGLKRSPGPLYGVRADVWQALALALAWIDGARDIDTEREEEAEAKEAKRAGRAA